MQKRSETIIQLEHQFCIYSVITPKSRKIVKNIDVMNIPPEDRINGSFE